MTLLQTSSNSLVSIGWSVFLKAAPRKYGWLAFNLVADDPLTHLSCLVWRLAHNFRNFGGVSVCFGEVSEGATFGSDISITAIGLISSDKVAAFALSPLVVPRQIKLLAETPIVSFLESASHRRVVVPCKETHPSTVCRGF